MKISDLERGVKRPGSKSKLNPLIHENAERMEIGHSFTITLEEGEELTPRSVGCSLAAYFRNLKQDKKFMARQSKERQIRVWRIK